MRAATRAAIGEMSRHVECLIDRARTDYVTAHSTAEIALRLIKDTMTADPGRQVRPRPSVPPCLRFG